MRDLAVLALDPSLTGFGICLPNGSTAVLKPKSRGCERLAFLRDKIAAIVDIWEPRITVLEGYSYGSRNSHSHAQGELGGVVRLWLWEHGYPYVEVPPSNLHKYATGKGNSSKDTVLQAAVHRSGHVFETNDAADAWWLHQMALAHYHPEAELLIPMPAHHRLGLKQVTWAPVTW